MEAESTVVKAKGTARIVMHHPVEVGTATVASPVETAATSSTAVTAPDVSSSAPSDDAVQITLMWSKPELDSGLSGYWVYFSWKSMWNPNQFVNWESEHKTMFTVVTTTSYTLKDAEGFAEYCFEVSALYAGGESSPPTNETCTTTPETSECMLGNSCPPVESTP